jgi:hypothetical protein
MAEHDKVPIMPSAPSAFSPKPISDRSHQMIVQNVSIIKDVLLQRKMLGMSL